MAKRSLIARREKELTAKMESAGALRTVVENSRAEIEELENQPQKSLLQKNELEIKLEEALQDSGIKDVKAGFQIMGSSISKEMGMMKAQLNRWKETTKESFFLHEKVQSLKSLVDSKIEKKQKENEELQTYVDMVSDNIYDNR
ncbi:hypothetical protein OROMI_006214 [Orobanche minor]